MKLFPASWNSLHRIQGSFFYMLLYLRRIVPIIVYQMGKVGSSSVTKSLMQQGVKSVYLVHRMNPDNIERVRQEYLDNNQTPPDETLGKTLYANIIKKCKRAKFITLVREPIGRNVSAFFENFKRFTGVAYKDANLTIEKLIKIFIEDYRHSVPLIWFDTEMKQTLGIDVYEYPFPKEEGYISIGTGNFELLILKLEVDDSIKEKVIAEYLDIEDFRLIRANVTQNKRYSDTYQDFLQTIELPESYVETMCSSEYIRHFYSDAEIDAIRGRWKERTCPEELPSAVHQELLRASTRVLS